MKFLRAKRSTPTALTAEPIVLPPLPTISKGQLRRDRMCVEAKRLAKQRGASLTITHFKQAELRLDELTVKAAVGPLIAALRTGKGLPEAEQRHQALREAMQKVGKPHQPKAPARPRPAARPMPFVAPSATAHAGKSSPGLWGRSGAGSTSSRSSSDSSSSSSVFSSLTRDRDDD